jgi:hypothetical protein
MLTAGTPHYFWFDGTNWQLLNPQTGEANFVGTCTTAVATAAKLGTLANYSLVNPSVVIIKFTGQATALTTLNVNSTGAKNVMYKGKQATPGLIRDGQNGVFFYDGTNWNLLNASSDEIIGYGICATAIGTAAKVVQIPNFQLTIGSFIAVKFTNGNSSTTATLNVNTTGAYGIRRDGNAITAATIPAGLIACLVFNGTYWEIINPIGDLQPAITGAASSTDLLVKPLTTGGQPQTRALNTLLLSPEAQTANTQILMAPATKGAVPTLKALSDLLQSPAAATANTQVLMAPATKGNAPTLKPINDFVLKTEGATRLALTAGVEGTSIKSYVAGLTRPGTYSFDAHNASDDPFVFPGVDTWSRCLAIIHANTEQLWCSVIAIPFGGTDTYINTAQSGTWSGWNMIGGGRGFNFVSYPLVSNTTTEITLQINALNFVFLYSGPSANGIFRAYIVLPPGTTYKLLDSGNSLLNMTFSDTGAPPSNTPGKVTIMLTQGALASGVTAYHLTLKLT